MSKFADLLPSKAKALIAEEISRMLQEIRVQHSNTGLGLYKLKEEYLIPQLYKLFEKESPLIRSWAFAELDKQCAGVLSQRYATKDGC